MTVHFAAARTPAHSPLARALSRRGHGVAANDNDGGARLTDDRLLYAALRHFAEHGLSAARMARVQAETAFFAGERESYDWWLGICSTLDKRLANSLATAVSGGKAS